MLSNKDMKKKQNILIEWNVQENWVEIETTTVFNEKESECVCVWKTKIETSCMRFGLAWIIFACTLLSCVRVYLSQYIWNIMAYQCHNDCQHMIYVLESPLPFQARLKIFFTFDSIPMRFLFDSQYTLCIDRKSIEQRENKKDGSKCFVDRHYRAYTRRGLHNLFL